MSRTREAQMIKIEGTRLIFRNFAGKPDKFNPRGGKRSFNVVLPNMEVARELEDFGWNVKYIQPRDEDDEPTPHLPVKVSYDNRPPKIYIVSGRTKTLLNEETVQSLDYAEIDNVDITISPYTYTNDEGEERISAYVKTMYVNIIVDELDAKYNFDDDEEDELPWENN